MMAAVTHVVILGGGPGGYEGGRVGAQLGSDVTVVDRDGIGGSAVLTDCVPSKTLIATAEVMTGFEVAPELGIQLACAAAPDDEVAPAVDLSRVNERVLALAVAQSEDIESRLLRDGVTVVKGTGRLDGPDRVVASTPEGEQALEADAVLVATGAAPRTLDSAQPDGERILTWEQVY